jgi:hypothetical protein
MDNNTLSQILEFCETTFNEGIYIEMASVLRRAYLIQSLHSNSDGQLIRFTNNIDIYMYRNEDDGDNDFIIKFSIIGFNSNNGTLIDIELENHTYQSDMNANNFIPDIIYDFLPMKIKIDIPTQKTRIYNFSSYLNLYKICDYDNIDTIYPEEIYEKFTEYIEDCIKHRVKELRISSTYGIPLPSIEEET